MIADLGLASFVLISGLIAAGIDRNERRINILLLVAFGGLLAAILAGEAPGLRAGG